MNPKPILHEIKSILRYPGGKSKALKKLLPLIPDDFSEFREPCVGGGSVFIAALQRKKQDAKFVINDFSTDLSYFWWFLQDDPEKFREYVLVYKNDFNNGKELFNHLKTMQEASPFQRAIRYFILNRISFSGAVDASGYSQGSYEGRFTDSIIERIIPLGNLIKDVQIERGDYEKHLFEDGDNVFLFIDPPYLKNIKSKLYGRKGLLHKMFDHSRLAYNLMKSPHRWLATLDDVPEIRNLYDFAYIYEWKHQYGMNNYKQDKAKKGKELFISNYEIKRLSQTKLLK